jgi:phosphatidylglycerophosphatase A
VSSLNDSGSAPLPDPSDGRAPFLATFLATGFYSGYIPWMSGTFGTLVGLLLYLIPGFEHPVLLSLLILVTLFAGVAVSARVASSVGHRLTRSAEIAKQKFQPGEHETADPSIIVIDEIVGMWIALLFLPKTVPVMIIAFFAFRVFDIVKPQPARSLERIPNGWGIMLDDVVAGAYANIATWGGWWLWERFMG